MTRNGGASSATSYGDLVDLVGGPLGLGEWRQVASPARTRIRSYGSIALSPGAGASCAEPSMGAQLDVGDGRSTRAC